MLTLLVPALLALLLHRLGWFAPFWRHRAALGFEREVRLLAGDVAWEERAARMRRQTAPVLSLR